MELARGQMGLVTAAQLDALRFSRHLVGRYLASKAWSRLTRGLYKIGAAAMTIEQCQLAALLAAGDGAALSHLSAAVKLRIDAPPVSLIQLTVPASRNHVPIAGVEVFRSRDLSEADVVLRGPFRVTNVGRTIVDLAASLSDDDLKAAIDSALRQNRAYLIAIGTTLKALRRGHPGASRLRRILRSYGLRDAIPASKLESKARSIIAEVNLGEAVHHYWEHDLRFVAELDYAWPDELVNFELDGYETHGPRDNFESDRARDRTLQWMGWRVLRFTWDQVKNQRQAVIDELRRNLLDRRAYPPRFTSQVPRCLPA